MKEIELKVIFKNFKDIKKKLRDLKAKKINPKSFEKNIIYDHKNINLKRKGVLLRLRKFGKKNILTLKKASKGKEGFKVREEINLDVESFGKTETILKSLGFFETFSYEKWRENYAYKGLTISLDETKVGNFMEVEGEYEDILNFLKEIGVSKENTLTLTYMDLFKSLKKA